jgi:hypothetical protein
MKLKTVAPAIAAIIALLTSCATFLGPRDVELPLYKLQEALNRQFPLNSRYLELFNITVSNPQLAMHRSHRRF